MPINPINFDPTYLRSVNNGLISGALFKDNASALPAGLVGMYEEALPQANRILERQTVLEFLTVWALLKKEVSAAFVAPLLSWTEEQVLNYIARYSNWFNAPVVGKYILYHERLRIFILQYIPPWEFEKNNKGIIRLCKNALESKVGDEFECYALEHYSSHLLDIAMITGIGSDLKIFCRNPKVWNRQIELSSGLNWSVSSIKNSIEYYSKYNPISCLEDYHNLLLLYQQSKDFIQYFSWINPSDLKDSDISQLCNLNIDNDYDAQYLYVVVIVKMHQIISSELGFFECKRLIVKLNEILGKLKSIDHCRLYFHDILPLCYIEDVVLFFNKIDLGVANLFSGSSKLKEYEQKKYLPNVSYNEFIRSIFSSEGLTVKYSWSEGENMLVYEFMEGMQNHEFPLNNTSYDFITFIFGDVISDAFKKIDLLPNSKDFSDVQSLNHLFDILDDRYTDLAPNAIMVIPILFSKRFRMNTFCDTIQLEWLQNICDCYNDCKLNSTVFAFLLYRAKALENVDAVAIQNQINWFALNWVSSHKYDIDEFLSYLCEQNYWQDGVTEFENWIIEILSKRKNTDSIALIDDQKYHVLLDVFWGEEKLLNESIIEIISPFSVQVYKDLGGSYYQNDDKARASKWIEFSEELEFIDDIYELDPKRFLQDDFAKDPYIRNRRSVNSPVSVQNIDWVKILPKLKNVDKLTLYATIHKVFLRLLCYENLNWNELPSNVKEFYNLHWVDNIRNQLKIKNNGE